MGAPRTGDSPAVRDYRSYCIYTCRSSLARALIFLLIFLKRRRVQYYYTAGPRRNLYDQIIGEEGQGQRGRIDGTPSVCAQHCLFGGP